MPHYQVLSAIADHQEREAARDTRLAAACAIISVISLVAAYTSFVMLHDDSYATIFAIFFIGMAITSFGKSRSRSHRAGQLRVLSAVHATGESTRLYAIAGLMGTSSGDMRKLTKELIAAGLLPGALDEQRAIVTPSQPPAAGLA